MMRKSITGLKMIMCVFLINPMMRKIIFSNNFETFSLILRFLINMAFGKNKSKSTKDSLYTSVSFQHGLVKQFLRDLSLLKISLSISLYQNVGLKQDAWHKFFSAMAFDRAFGKLWTKISIRNKACS